MRKLYWILILWNFAIPFAVAQNLPVVEIDKIIINLPKNKQNDLPKSGSVIKPSNANLPTLTLSDSVNQLSGISIQQYGGLESSTAISIRGSNSQHVQIVWDGIPLDSASGKGLTLSNIPAHEIEKIQIYKTTTPIGISQNNSSGTISLTSKPIPKNWHGQFGLGLGSFETRELFLNSSWGGKQNAFGLGIDYLSTEGNFDFQDNNGTPQNTNDDQTITRQNNDLNRLHAQFQWQNSISQYFNTTLKSDLFSTDKGVAGFASFQSQNASLQQQETLSSFKLESTNKLWQNSDFQNQIYLRTILTEFSDPFGEIGLGAAQQNHDTTLIVGNKCQMHNQFGPHFSWDNLAHYTYESFLPVDELAGNQKGSQSQRHQVQLATQPSLSLWNNTLDITGKLHWLLAFYNINDNDPSLNASNTYESTRNETPLMAALSLKKQLTQTLHLKSAIAREVRLPQFNEMFGDQGYVLGNPKLTNEQTIKYDLGTVWQTSQIGFLKSFRFETSYFIEWSKDLIEFEIVNGVAKASNIGKTQSQGIESFLYAEPADWLQTTLGYTYLNAKDTNSDRYLIGRPKHEANFGSVIQLNDFSLQQNLEWSHEKYLDSLNLQKIENRLRLDVAANYHILKKSVLSFEIKNLTNSTIEDALGYPLPGRSFYLRFKSTW